MDKRDYSERDVCTKLITPAILQAGWAQSQFREEVKLTDGCVIMRGKLASRVKNPDAKSGPKRADYVLYAKPNVPLAVVEAKRNVFDVGRGILQQYYTGAGIPHFTGRALKKVFFPLPPIAEQRRIVAKVDQLMSFIDQLEAKQTRAQRLAEAFAKSAVTAITNTGPVSNTA